MDFEKLYSDEFHSTYVFIRYMVGNAELAEDFTQETFLRILKAKNLALVTNASVYTRQIARNLVYDYYRKKHLLNGCRFQHRMSSTKLRMFQRIGSCSKSSGKCCLKHYKS